MANKIWFIFPEILHCCFLQYHVDGLVQEWRNSIANALELRLSCTNPSTLYWTVQHSPIWHGTVWRSAVTNSRNRSNLILTITMTYPTKTCQLCRGLFWENWPCYNGTLLHPDTADSRLTPSQWETSLQSNNVSHWLGANLEPAKFRHQPSIKLVCYLFSMISHLLLMMWAVVIFYKYPFHIRILFYQ